MRWGRRSPDLRIREDQTDGGKCCRPGEQSVPLAAEAADEADRKSLLLTQARRKSGEARDLRREACPEKPCLAKPCLAKNRSRRERGTRRRAWRVPPGCDRGIRADPCAPAGTRSVTALYPAWRSADWASRSQIMRL